MRAAKWHNEIEIFRQIKPCIILEGNILDQFQYPSEPFRNRHLPEYLYKLLKDLGYNVVVIYDESKGFYAVSGGQKDLVAFADLLQEVPGLRITNDMIRCPFSAQGSCYTPSNPESADSARNKNDGQLLDSVCPAAATIGEVVTNALRQSDVSVAIIMDMASRYIVSPDQMDLLDVRVYTELQRALRCAEEADTNGSLSKNLLIFLTNKVNDLPTWFYLNNPDVKAISITTPDAQARLEFVSGNQLPQFFQRDIYAEDMRFYTENPSQLDKLQKKFVGLTEGFSYSDLIGMRTLCYREHYRMSHLANVVDLYRYGIKENKWATVDRNTIDQLQKDMYANILGQNSALAKVMDVIKRSVVGRGGVSNNRPKGVLFFAGPTGTGKTETAKALARNIFGDESCCLRFDMAEYKQSHSDQKLLGAPPGYIGYEAGGQLTNAVRDNPFSIILFDEIEKAHPSILDKFLQILDDGRLTDGQGNTVYFSESIIIFTSNKGIVGTVSEVDEFGNRIEKNKQLIDPKDCVTHKEMQAKVIDGIRNYFKYELGRPELLNRIGEDNIVVYDFIRPDVAESILKLHINRVKADFKDNSEIEIDTSAIEKVLLEKCCSSEVLEYGGRGIRNTVESCLYTPLTRFIYDHQDMITAGKAIVIRSLDLNSSPVGIDAEVEG
jgi:ATP-dependent Clp protease ATP-binding subunit ClpA